MKSIVYPPIQWRYFILYWRLPDGRIRYFRGLWRRALFVRNFDTDCVTEPESTRLFEEVPALSDASFAESLRSDTKRQQVHFSGFNDTVLRTHLIIPGKPVKRRPPG